MFINKDSLQVKTSTMQNYISLGQYLVEAKYTYAKIWGKDSGRNLNGTQSGTLLGIFPKIVCQFRKLTQSEVELLAPILDSATQTLQYYDPNKKAITTLDTYTGDYEITNNSIIDSNHKNEGFQISFIARKKRS